MIYMYESLIYHIVEKLCYNMSDKHNIIDLFSECMAN